MGLRLPLYSQAAITKKHTLLVNDKRLFLVVLEAKSSKEDAGRLGVSCVPKWWKQDQVHLGTNSISKGFAILTANLDCQFDWSNRHLEISNTHF